MRRSVWLILMVVALLLGSSATAQMGAGYDLTWYTIDTGGTTEINGGPYALAGTLGQPDAATSSGGPYQLASGFWHTAATGRNVYLPLALRGL
jgi:hypothetical protein